MLGRLFDFYIHSSLHVSFAVLALAIVTYYMFGIQIDNSVLLFVFSSSLIGYNFTKYNTELIRKNASTERKAIFLLSVLCSILAIYTFFKLETASREITLLTGFFTLLYILPFYKGKNFRNRSGIKIYIVALCWVLSTLILPLAQAGYDINADVLIKCMQRFLLVIILILIFEIIDLKEDNPSLKTVPQSIGVRNTKILGIVLLAMFFMLEFALTNFKITQLYINVILAIITLVFTLLASEKKSKYYTTFWVESIPILWLVLVVFFR